MVKWYAENIENMSSSLYDSKMSIDYHTNIPYVSMHFQNDGMTPGCSVVASLHVGSDTLEG